MLRSEKAQQIDAIKSRFDKMTSAVFVDFQRMTVEEVTKLRDDLRAKVLKEFIKENEKLKIKAGVLDGQVLDAKGVENQLAALPGKNEARAMLLATLMAPAQRMVTLLNAPAGNFVRLLKAKEQRG